MNAFYQSHPAPSREALSHFLFAQEPKATKYWLAVSGGLDSMVLMDLFASWARVHNLAAEILHVNYGLRGVESCVDAVVDCAGGCCGASMAIRPAMAVSCADCAVVVAPFSVDGVHGGTIGVLGPARMNYAATLAAVGMVSQRLTRSLSEGEA